MDNAATMRTVPRPACPVCRTAGEPAYSDLRDGVFGTAGAWSMRRCLNRRCGLRWLDPAPDPRDLALAYAGDYTHADSHDDLRSPLRMGARRAMVARMLGYPSPEDRRSRLLGNLLLCSPQRREYALYRWFYLPFVRGGRVLEVGCGAGAQLATLRDSGWTTLGVEFDAAAAAAARARGLEILDGELQALALPDASFDAIVMAHVIEHVPDPVGLFAECRRLLKPEGRLVAITPNADSLGHRLFAHSWRGLEPPRHLVVFTAPALALCARQAGFGRLQITPSARDAANVMLASSRIARVAPGERIESPRAGTQPPLRFRMLEHLERACDVLGIRFGEELVLVAHPEAPPRAMP